MAVSCTNDRIFYRRLTPAGGEIRLSINDLGVTDSDGLGVFFSRSEITKGDDEDDNTFFPNATGTTFRNAGSVTNSGTEIIYTVDATKVDGDQITFAYDVTNGTNNSGNDASCQFQIVFEDEPNDVVADCRSVNTAQPNSGSIFIPISSLAATAPLPSSSIIQILGVTDANGADASVQFTTAADDLSIIGTGSTVDGVYAISFNIRTTLSDGTFGISNTCTLNLTVGGTNEVICTDFNINANVNSINVSSLLAANSTHVGAVTVLVLETSVAATRGADGTTIEFSSTAAAGSYEVDYRLIDSAGNQSGTCTLSIARGVTGGDGGNGLSCAQTQWINGTPVLQCGGEASDHEARLILANGQPLTVAEAAVAFVTTGLPAGATVQVVASNGNGTYTFRIDPSNVQCSNTISAFIGGL